MIANDSSLEERSDGQPVLSVIVPTYNAADDLRKCLSALAASIYTDFDVLVVDDGSTMPTEPIVTRQGFRYLRIDGPGGPARGRNRGAQHVNGRHLVFIDADVCVHPDTLGRFARAFEENPHIGAVVGAYDDAPADTGFVSQYKNLLHHYTHQSSGGAIPTFWAGCGAIRRDLFLAFGGFDEKRYRRPAIEDIELGMRLSAAGHCIVLDPDVKGTHLKRWTLRNLVKTDILDRGIPWIRLMYRAGSVPQTLNVKPVQRVCVAIVYLAISAVLAAMWIPQASFAALAAFAALILLNLDFYHYLAKRRGWWFALRVIPLHWLYFFYCGICVFVATALHFWESWREPPASTGRMPFGEVNRTTMTATDDGVAEQRN